MAWLSPARQKEIDEIIRELKALSNSSDLNEIIQASGLEIAMYDFNADGRKDISGAIVKKGYDDFEKTTILINKDTSENRKIFTIAHEFGHYALGHLNHNSQKLYRIDFKSEYYPEDDEIRKQELEANYFAGAILMPQDVMLRIIQEFNGANLPIPEIAKAFKVSESAVRTRIDWIKRNLEQQN